MWSRGAGVPSGYPPWVSWLVAAPPTVFGVASVLTADEGWPYALAVALSLTPWFVEVAGVPLPRWLFATLVIVPLAAVNLGVLEADLSGDSHTQFTLMILVWLVGEMIATASILTTVVIGGTVVAITAGRALVEPSFGHSWAFWAAGTGIALVTGFMIRRQQQTLSELRVAQAAMANEARLRERQRIAREVHDVVAHTLTVTLMHLDAASRALDRDPAAVRRALEDAKTLGRRSLADIRTTVGLLRVDGEPSATHALPDGSDIGPLLESYRDAGLAIDSRIDGDAQRLSPAAGLTLYRILQESLANAAAHAPGAPVSVRISARGPQIEVEVSNPLVGSDVPARPGPAGHGLIGMAERVRVLGGQLDAGARDGRWQVEARFPARSADDSTQVPA